MSLRNTPEEYGSVAKFFHWLIFVLVTGLVTLGFCLDLFEGSPYQGTAYTLHKLTGLTVLSIMVMRLAWKSINPNPISLNRASPLRYFLERTVHATLYIVLLLMPLSGWSMSTAAGKPPKLLGIALPFPGIPNDEALAELFAAIHMKLAWFLIVLVILHVLAALKHHFIDRDSVLKRMW